MTNTLKDQEEWLEKAVSDGHINDIKFKKFTNPKKIGKGGYATVYKYEWKDCKLTVALKRIEVDKDLNKNIVDDFVSELKLLQKVDSHPNIIAFHGVTKDENGYYNMVLQYANEGNLREYLRLNFTRLQWPEKFLIAKEAALGLLFLHENNIIHRDLHSKNILIYQGHPKIADFGLSKQINEMSLTSKSAVHGMPAYIEPKCFTNSKYKRDIKSDIYSFGVILWEISSGKPPFEIFEEIVVLCLHIAQGNREEPIEGTPPQYVDLYKQCWDNEPDNRPKMSEILEMLNQLTSSEDLSQRITNGPLIENNESSSLNHITPSASLDLSVINNLVNSYENELNLQWQDEASESYDLSYLNRLISGPNLAFINVRLTNLTETNFVVTFSVINTESHPLEITFLNDIQVSFKCKVIGKMSISHTNVKFIPQKNIKLKIKFIPSDNFDSFNRFLFTDEKLNWHLEGKISVKHKYPNPIEVELSKHIEFDGMKTLAISSIDVPSEYSEGGISIKMNIKNASQIRVELDNMPFNIKYMNQIIGKISSTRFSNDNNTLSFSGCLLPGDTIEKLNVMAKTFSKVLSGEELHLIFDARASLVSWLNKISLTVVITKETKINFNYEIIDCAWDFIFDPNDQYSPRITLQNVIKYSNLFPLGIYKASCKMVLIYKESQFATFNIPYTTISDSLGTIESSFTTKLNIFSENSKDLFVEILRKIFMIEEVIFTVKGELNVLAKTPVGDIEMKQIQFNFDKNIKSQIHPGITINSMEIINATKDAIEIRALATITNPLNVGIYLGSNVEFDLISDQNIKIASMIIENFKLKRENDDTIVKLKYLPSKDSGFKVIENYLNGRNSLLSIKATNSTTSIYPLRGAFEAIKLKASLPGINAQFINEIEVSLRTKDSFMLHNPLKTKLHIFGFTSKVINMENKQIAIGITEPKNDGTVVEPGQTKRIRIESTNMDVGNAIRNIKDNFSANGVRENVECVLMFGIGEDIRNLFRIDLKYTQQDIKVIWDLGFFKF